MCIVSHASISRPTSKLKVGNNDGLFWIQQNTNYDIMIPERIFNAKVSFLYMKSIIHKWVITLLLAHPKNLKINVSSNYKQSKEITASALSQKLTLNDGSTKFKCAFNRAKYMTIWCKIEKKEIYYELKLKTEKLKTLLRRVL